MLTITRSMVVTGILVLLICALSASSIFAVERTSQSHTGKTGMQQGAGTMSGTRNVTVPTNSHPSSAVNISLYTDRPHVRPGDEISLILEADRDCYVTLMSISPSGRATLLWPNGRQQYGFKLLSRVPLRIPGPDVPVKIQADGKAPLERIVAVATTQKGGAFNENDFVQVKGTVLKAFAWEGGDFSEQLRQMLETLPQPVRWGTAEAVVRVSSEGVSVRSDGAQPEPAGTVRVTLHIFSGRPDPTWTLTPDQAAELVKKIQSLQPETSKKLPELVSGLGYRGFSVDGVSNVELDPNMNIHNNMLDFGQQEVKGIDSDYTLERWLLKTAGDRVDSELKSYVEQNLVELKRQDAAPPPAPGTIPSSVYQPQKWNNSKIIRQSNNCYNYGNNRITNTFAQPGRACGKPYGTMTCAEVVRAAECDGLVQAPEPRASDQGSCLALVVSRNSDFQDYHWYRLDATGTWSHKPGQTPAVDHDNSGRKISDPRSCDRGPYKDFCGFFISRPAAVRIQ